jgi:hypothetical protein
LSDLLDLPEQAQQEQAIDRAAQPMLTRREEQELLRAANQIGTPTLAPSAADQDQDSAPRSFVSDLAGVAHKYPVLTVLAAGGIAFLLARRRR